MHAISLKCPECGAKLGGDLSAQAVTCEYCGTTSRVRRRTGFFERPEPVRAGPGQRFAVQQHSPRWVGMIGGAVAVSVAAGVVIPILAARQPGAATDSATAAATEAPPPAAPVEAPPLPEPTWHSQAAIVVELTGDDVADVVGRVKTPDGDIVPAAFDGASGQRLWMSEPVRGQPKAFDGQLVVAGDKVVASDRGTRVIAVSTADGSAAWSVELGEKFHSVCQAEGGDHIVVTTADEVRTRVALADGTAEPDAGEAPCLQLTDDWGNDARAGQLWSSGWYYSQLGAKRFDGMGVQVAIVDRVAGGVVIGLGYKSPGTAVPMLAAFRWSDLDARIQLGDAQAAARRARSDKSPELRTLEAKVRRLQAATKRTEPELLWTAVVPEHDPLSATAGAPDPAQVAITAEYVVAAYEAKSGVRAAAFRLGDGSRAWDVALPGRGRLSSIAASSSHVYAVRWSGVRAMSIATGDDAYVIQ